MMKFKIIVLANLENIRSAVTESPLSQHLIMIFYQSFSKLAKLYLSQIMDGPGSLRWIISLRRSYHPENCCEKYPWRQYCHYQGTSQFTTQSWHWMDSWVCTRIRTSCQDSLGRINLEYYVTNTLVTISTRFLSVHYKLNYLTFIIMIRLEKWLSLPAAA